jgi:anhydro-N-acetylmuramic acid kinase
MIVVGLMSGVSAQGIDVAVCEIDGAPPTLRAEVLASLTIPWPMDLQKMVKRAWLPGQIDVADLCLLDVAVGEAFAAAALEGIAHAGFYPEQVDLIGVQGQTVRHEVRDDGHVLSAFQLGQASIITEWTGITTVSDFRQRDVAAGGQGAPLTGFVDWLLLRHPTRFRAVHYVDHVASVSFLPPVDRPEIEPRAFEIGPGTVLLAQAEERLHQAQLSDNGRSVPTANVDETLLRTLLSHPYLDRQPPKTAGGMLFNELYASAVWEDAAARGVPPDAILETFVEFLVQSTVGAYQRFAPGEIDEIILGGHGLHYPYLMQRLRAAFAPLPVLSHEDVGLDGASKEALTVAVLAYEAWHNRPGTLPCLTGAQRATPLGSIIPGPNYQHLLHETW